MDNTKVRHKAFLPYLSIIYNNLHFSIDYIYIYIYKCVNSGFSLEVDDICAILDYYALHALHVLPKFRDNLSVRYSVLKKMGPIGCPETSVKNYHYTRVISQKDAYIKSSKFLYIGIKKPQITPSVEVQSNTEHKIAGTETMTKPTQRHLAVEQSTVQEVLQKF